MNGNIEHSDLFNIYHDKVIYYENNQVAQIAYNSNKQDRGQLKIEADPCYITFPQLSKIDYINHGFSTRLGGVSKEHLSTMNLSFTRADDRNNVITNYKRICRSIGIPMSGLVFSDQIHDTKIIRVTKEDMGKGIEKDNDMKGFDGLITNEPGVCLVTFYADCVPLYFVDRRQKAIGLSHSGWRGTVRNIAQETIDQMRNEFNSEPEDIIAVIGPSICRNCYEVSDDVANEVKKVYKEDIIKKLLEEKEDGKYQLDLWLANRYNMIGAGIREDNISISSICTCCNSNLLYSHRATDGKRGNLAAFLSII